MTQPAAIDRTPEVTAFAEHAVWSGVHSSETAAWLELRKELTTASDVAAIMGEDPDRSALEVYVDKRTEYVPEKIPPWDPRAVGRVLEQPLLAEVAHYRGWQYRAGGYLLRSRRLPFLGATLDAEVERGDGVWCDFEGKTTELVGDWDEETGQMPKRVLIQVQTQLLVTGAELAIVFALLRRYRPVQIPIYPSPALHEVIAEYAEAFMERVRNLDPPQPDASQSSRRALSRLYPAEDGAIVDLPPDAIEWTREYQEVTATLRELESKKRHLQSLLKASIGNATFGLLPEPVGNKRCWRWQTQERERYEVEETSSRVLLALKNPPQGARVGQHAPTEANNPLQSALRASVEPESTEPAAPIRFTRRKRSRR